jgi:hypothetical protein
MREFRLRRFAKRPGDVFAQLDIVETDNDNRAIYSCFTVEPPWRNNKPNESCVPVGRYKIVWEYSNKFGRNLWELKGVPGRDETKLHVANRARELQGCMGPGTTIEQDVAGWKVWNSRVALNEIHRHMQGMTETFITIEDVWGSSTS